MNIDAPKKENTLGLRALWKEAFGDKDAFLDLFWRVAFSPSRCRCVTVDGRIAAALYWFDASCRGQKIAYLYAIATAKAYRGQGLCRALMENTHRHLEMLGYKGALLVPSEANLFGFYEKLGYQTATYIREQRCQAAQAPLALRPLSVCEYAEKRRALLPEGSVWEEGAGLRFLETQAAFYEGEGVLLAARKEGERLFCAELLGDYEKTPAVVAALGCKEGLFRTQGKERPFTMWYPLGKESILPPSYFAFAFD